MHRRLSLSNHRQECLCYKKASGDSKWSLLRGAPRLSCFRMRTNTAEYLDGYTNAPIVQSFPSAFNARSEVKSPKAAPQRTDEWGDNNHANHSGCNPALSSTRGVADLALQPWLGILSQRWFGSRCIGPRNPFAPRAHITPGLFSLARATLCEARDPRLCVHAVSFFDRPCA
jgi:hypothetical protein